MEQEQEQEQEEQQEQEQRGSSVNLGAARCWTASIGKANLLFLNHFKTDN